MTLPTKLKNWENWNSYILKLLSVLNSQISTDIKIVAKILY